MKNKKMFLALLATTLATPVLVSSITTEGAYDKPFTDISTKNPYYDIIHSMRDKGIINGFEDGTFRPNESISRKHAAALISRAVNLENTDKFVKPNDLAKNNPYYADIKKIMEAGLLEVDKNGNINPNKPLTRGEMAKILTVAFDLEVKANYDFNDVPSTHKYNKYVRAIYSNGVTTGYEDGTFKTNGSLTRAHYAVFMYRAMNLDENFVAKPIEGETSNNEKPSNSEMLSKDDINSYKPENYDSSKNELEQIKIRVEQGHNRVTETVYSESNLEFLKMDGKRFNLSGEEYINIVNETIRTNSLYVGEGFSLYYDFDSNRIKLTYKNG